MLLRCVHLRLIDAQRWSLQVTSCTTYANTDYEFQTRSRKLLSRNNITKEAAYLIRLIFSRKHLCLPSSFQTYHVNNTSPHTSLSFSSFCRIKNNWNKHPTSTQAEQTNDILWRPRQIHSYTSRLSFDFRSERDDEAVINLSLWSVGATHRVHTREMAIASHTHGWEFHSR